MVLLAKLSRTCLPVITPDLYGVHVYVVCLMCLFAYCGVSIVTLHDECC
jgi:hypothetical protein